MAREAKEREEKERGEEEGIEEKWARDPLGAVVFGLIVIWLGLTLFGANLGTLSWISWENWWSWFLFGVGTIFLLEVIIRYIMPAYRRPIGGRLILGVILLVIGGSGTFLAFGIGKLWPLILIAVGLAMLLGGFFRRGRPW